MDGERRTIANPEDGGRLKGEGDYKYGEEATVKAMENSGYRFVNWTENGVEVSTMSEYRFIVKEARVLVANFKETGYDIKVTAKPAHGGTVHGAGTYEYGQKVTVVAKKKNGYNFINWTENGVEVSKFPDYGFVVKKDRNLVANFKAKKYKIATFSNPSNGGKTKGTGIYEYGQQAIVRAIPNKEYKFVSWTEKDTVVSRDAKYSFTVKQARRLVANFEIITYKVSVSANPSSAGTVKGAGNYTRGAIVKLQAIPATGYVFKKWTENDKDVSYNGQYNFKVVGSRSLVAHFEKLTSVNDIAKSESFTVYPNPAKDFVTFKFENNKIKRDKIKIMLHGVSGKSYSLNNFEVFNGKITIDVSDKKSGIYYIQLIIDGKKSEMSKVIIMK